MALMESNFENRLSFVEESRFSFFIIMFGENGSPMKVAPKWSSKETWVTDNEMSLLGEPFWLSFFLSATDEQTNGLFLQFCVINMLHNVMTSSGCQRPPSMTSNCPWPICGVTNVSWPWPSRQVTSQSGQQLLRETSCLNGGETRLKIIVQLRAISRAYFIIVHMIMKEKYLHAICPCLYYWGSVNRERARICYRLQSGKR